MANRPPIRHAKRLRAFAQCNGISIEAVGAHGAETVLTIRPLRRRDHGKVAAVRKGHHENFDKGDNPTEKVQVDAGHLKWQLALPFGSMSASQWRPEWTHGP